MQEIKDKGMDSAKITIENLKDILRYHFCNTCYKDLKLRKKDLIEVVHELLANADTNKIDGNSGAEVPQDIPLKIDSLSDGEIVEDDEDDAEIVEPVELNI